MRIMKFIAFSTGLLLLSACGAVPSTTLPTNEATTPSTTPATYAPNKMVALTFDDGPNTTTMVEILDLLKEYDAKATFFVIGKKVDDTTTPVLQRALDEGHEIANHSMNHEKMAEMTDEQILFEVSECQKVVKDAVGIDMYYFRAPFASINDRMFELIDMPFVRSAAVAQDGTIGSLAADRAWRITTGVYDGAIAGMHCFNGNDATVEALKTILPELKAQGYEFVTLTELYTRSDAQIPVPAHGVIYIDNKPQN